MVGMVPNVVLQQCTLAAFSPTPHNQERYCDCPNVESTRPASLILFHSALVPGNQHRHAPHDMRGTHPGPSNQSTRRGQNVFGRPWSSTHSLFLAKRVWLPHCTFIARPFTSSGDLLTADGFVLSCPIHLHLLQIERESVATTVSGAAVIVFCHRVLLGDDSDTALVLPWQVGEIRGRSRYANLVLYPIPQWPIC